MKSARGLFRVLPIVAGAAGLMAAATIDARVTKIELQPTPAPVQGGQTFGTVGAYEMLRGKAYGEIDPSDRRNAGITDIQAAPKNASGKVEYITEFTIHKPVDMSKASGVMIEVVPNRGGIAVPYARNNDGLPYTFGDTILNVAWQGDLRTGDIAATSLGIIVPIATGITSKVWDRFIAVGQTAGANTTTQSLSGAGRTPNSLNTALASLVSFVTESPAGVKTGTVNIPSTDWAFADCRTVAFPGTPDATRICLKNGFDPNLGYELVYVAKDPFVLGVGEAAMRDVTSFMRYAAKDDFNTANPLAGKVQWVLGFGNSQSGRLQKHFLNNGFNEDEQGRIVMDGMNPNIAGMMGSFNIRFAQPGDIAELYDPGADGPLWWMPYVDTARGRPASGLLMRCMATNTCPKIMETYGGPEVWYSRGSVGMAGTKGTEDLPLPNFVRRYFHAGTTHGGGAGGFNLGTASTNPNNLAANPNPQSDFNRALYVAQREWVMKGTPPPPSAYPRVTDGTLVPANSAALGWPNIPNTPKPDGVMNSVLDYDYGPNFRYADGSGVIDNVPPPIKQVIPTLAVKMDKDGNEIAGLRSVLQQLPLGTYTGWNPIPSGPLKGREASLAAGYIPFPQTKAQRIASGDPRLSIEERYGDLWTYYFMALNVINKLASQRLLLANDANLLVNQLLNNILANKVLPKKDVDPKSGEEDDGDDDQ